MDGGEEDGPAQDNAAEPADQEGGSSLPRLAPAPNQTDMSSSFRVENGRNGSHEGDRTPHSQDTREGQNEAAGADSGTTPMDMDTKEPKVEGQ